MVPFPWPNAPQPSEFTQIPNGLLFGAGGSSQTLLDVARRMEGAISAAGYFERRYLGAGCNGFAVILDLEHITSDGARKPGAAGFAPPGQEEEFSLTDYVKRLFYAPPGYYRQIVFVVSDENAAASTAAPTAQTLRAIAKDGSAALPPAFASVPYTWKYKVVALVYEFRKGPGDGDAQFIPATGRLGATVHLKKAKLF